MEKNVYIIQKKNTLVPLTGIRDSMEKLLILLLEKQWSNENNIGRSHMTTQQDTVRQGKTRVLL